VLVAAVFHGPSMHAPGTGERPQDVAAPSTGLAFPTVVVTPRHPPSAWGSGVVTLEAHVDATGTVTDAVVIHSAPGFDDVAQEAVRNWHFRPARVQGTPCATLVYVVVGFPIPATGRLRFAA
jgi:TonB family protein